MPSIRSHLFRLFIRHSLRKGERQDLHTRRQNVDLNARRFPNANGVQIVPVVAGASPAEWLIPEGELPNSAVLYLHGGAYVCGSLDSHRCLASHIAATSKVRVLLVDYRLAPEHPYPAAVDDAVIAFEWIKHTQRLHADRIVVMGDSAGGGLTLAMAIRMRDGSQDLPRALICLSPWTDLSLSGETIESLIEKDPFFNTTRQLAEAAADYAGGAPLTTAQISPKFDSLERLPPLFIQVGSDEILLSDSLDLVRVARAAGLEVHIDVWQGMWHVWQFFFTWMPEARDAVHEVGRRIQGYLSETPVKH
ncbi:TPA: alpha/beta hydrolase [Pseudomonas aeruginosa]|uniref:alpha/beta hydrolase n=1 Tax=Pseudomonas aeruginosa TaxID=287 RepID=UPI000F85BFF4|nr:alpha/beta hydrolase [Pseudomonas aeruginosa]RUI00772.1 alpha/beta hydrolase [Pseudomonas aeruginosa]HBO3119413.1 alpha/beta hydrolase [Pseudomonas aeruginosa]